MGEDEDAGADADVLVQAVELVEAAEAFFQPARARGEQHPGAHPPQGEQAGKDDQRLAPVPEAGRVGSDNVGQG